MNSVMSFLMAPAHQWKMKCGLWIVCFAVLLTGGGWFMARELYVSMDDEIAHGMENYTKVRATLVDTLAVMDRELTAAPCSPAYARQQRTVAFLPDGMNELFFVENNKVICTANSGLLPKPYDLGQPDIAPIPPAMVTLWINRSLEGFGLPGLRGTFAVHGNNGIVVPTTPTVLSMSDWLDYEVIVKAHNGRSWHTAGVPGIYAQSAARANGPFGLHDNAVTRLQCDPEGLHCLAARVTLPDLLRLGGVAIGILLLVCGIVAAWLANVIYRVIARHWSFEHRFLRRFQKRGIVCAYQPLLDLQTDLVSGCELLARWRDVDGTLIYPDRFIPIIEQRGLTKAFTRLIVAQAYIDLLDMLPPGHRLQVNFNIFPQDLEADALVDIFKPFMAPHSPFDLVIEIVETGEIQIETAQNEIEKLRGAGISVYIDDFGAGYSSMHALAELSVDGVKLDRSFAMAPDGSVMARMLDHAVDLVQQPGRKVVVEGVETAARLAWLKASGKVNFAQGYYISRPIERDAFADFLVERSARAERRAA